MLLLWEMIILGHYKLSFLERLSSSLRVRFHGDLIMASILNWPIHSQ